MIKGGIVDDLIPNSFLAETIKKIEGSGHVTEEVEWVGSSDGNYAISWEEFTKISNFDYDSGFGGEEIPVDLVVVGNDWWLERYEYDGSEWWEYKTKPRMCHNARPITRIVHPDGYSWVSVEEVQNYKEEDD